MLDISNPLGFIADIWNRKKVDQWIGLLFQMGSSVLITFLFTCGTALVGTGSWAISIGSGMVIAAVIATIFLRRSPLTKGMIFVLPSAEAARELETNVQVISK